MPEHPSRPAEIRSLMGARALPPLLLVLFHYHEGHGYEGLPLFDVFVAKGYLWVEFFFALSGFVLCHVYGSRARELLTANGYGTFLKNRLARMYPVHLAMLLIFVVMMVALRALAARGGYVSVFDAPSWHPHTGLAGFIANLFLVQAWHVLPHLSWNWVAWFVSVEFFLCLIFPLYAWLAGGGMLRAGSMILAGFAMLYGLAQTSGHGLDITYDWGILRGMADFAIGVGMAMLYRELRVHGSEAWPVSVLSAVQLFAVAWFFTAMTNTGWSHTTGDFWVVPPMTALILAVSFDRGIVARALQTKALRQLGEWSFAIYMGQTAWLLMLRFAEHRLYPGVADAHWVHIAEPIGLVAVCTLWGWLLTLYVEHPANRAIRGYFRKDNLRDSAGA